VPTPLTFHVTAVLLEPLTLALNCCVAPACIADVDGETDTATELEPEPECPFTFTVALPDLLRSAALVAVTVTAVEGAEAGAV
jgi:hypothetical protein